MIEQTQRDRECATETGTPCTPRVGGKGSGCRSSYGRQSMREFELHFAKAATSPAAARTSSAGSPSPAPTTPQTGRVLMVKQYLGKHAVRYTGEPDGEGSIQGTWEITFLGMRSRGRFCCARCFRRPTGDEPISEIR